MSRLPTPPRSDKEIISYLDRQNRILTETLDDLQRQVSSISQGKVAGFVSSHSAAPSDVIMARGDFVKNTTPSVETTASADVVVLGWICTTDGTASAGSVLPVRAFAGDVT